MGIERRRTKRLESKLFADFESLPLKELLGRGIVIDLSTSGIGVESELDLNMGETYICTIEIPWALKARLVRREIKGQMKRYGLQFIGPGFFDKLVLKRLMKGRLFTGKIQ